MPRLNSLSRAVLPRSADSTANGLLSLAGHAATTLAEQFGTPLYVFDEAEIRLACRSYTMAYPVREGEAPAVHYASKAYLAPFLCAILRSEGIAVDVVSGGELAVALAGGYSGQAIRMHGNNKSQRELEEAVAAGVYAIVLDNTDEITRLSDVCQRRGVRQRVLLRLAPGITAHTHEYLQTGTVDSKFGFSVQGGAAEAAVARLLRGDLPLFLAGYHAHIGTQIMELEAYRLTIRTLLDIAERFWRSCGYWPDELCPGGGAAIAYTGEDVALDPLAVAAVLRQETAARSQALGLPVPTLSVEPGRSIIGRAGVAIYRVCSVKQMPGRRYVVVDGGMADNIRPALYGAEYTAIVATRLREDPTEQVTIAGPYCESGDILARDIFLPPTTAGDLLVFASAGAYCLPMSSNYNMALRPAVVLLTQAGEARLVQRRQTYADLMSLDV